MSFKKRVAKRDEHAGERRFITRLTERGYLAFHVGQAVDGFPDIMAIKGDKVFLFEVKDMSRRLKPIEDVFEKSQPVFAQRLNAVKFTRVFALFAESEVDSYMLYEMGNMLESVLLRGGDNIHKVSYLYSIGSADTIIDYINRL